MPPHAVQANHQPHFLILRAADGSQRIAGSAALSYVPRHQRGPVVQPVLVPVHIEHRKKVPDMHGSTVNGRLLPLQRPVPVLVGRRNLPLRFKGRVILPPVVEWPYQAPGHIRLLHVRKGNVPEKPVTVGNQPLFKLPELRPSGRSPGRELRHVILPLGGAPAPDALRKRQYAGVKGILFQHPLLTAQVPVAPHGHDGSQRLLIPLRHLAGLLEKHLVYAGLGISPVNVKAIAVNALHSLVHPGSGLALAPAHQHGILIVRATRRPHDHLLALPADILRHARNKILHRNVHLVGPHVKKPSWKQGNGLVHDILQYGNALLRLHAGLHGLGERLAVPRHVDLRNHLDIQPGAIIRQVLQLFLRIKFARQP